LSSAALVPAPATASSAEPARAPRPARRDAGVPLYLQRAALTVGAPDSPLEEEAEEVSAQVMRLPEGACCAGCASGAGCERPGRRPGVAGVQRAAAGSVPSAGHAWLKSPGQGVPLDADLRNRIEPALGTGLGHVRVHADADAQSRASALQAKAFTHGSHIWLGRGQSPRDAGLMAHEATHVVQQGAGDTGGALLQRRPADYRHPEDGANVRQRLEGRIAEEVEDPPSDVSPGEARRRMGRVDRGKLVGKRSEIGPAARPDVDRPAEARPGIEQAAETTQDEADKPAEPIAEAEGEKAEKEKGEKEKEPEAPGAAAAETALAAAEAAFAFADSITAPAPEPTVTTPDPVEPVDAAGQPLPGEPAADDAVADLAARAQSLRERGLALRAQAAEIRANADLMRGNIRLVRGGIAQADASLALSGEQLAYRRGVVGQAGQALTLAEEKAAKVAAEAPGFKAQTDEGAEESGPMAAETNELAAENAAQAPDDADAAEKAQEQGGKIAQVQQGSATMDQAIRSTGEKATSLSADAERAKAVNEKTAVKLTGVDETLTGTDERLTQMRETTQGARDSVDALAGEPDMLTASADELDMQAAALIAASLELEQRLRSVQSGYGAEMRAVPAQEFVADEEGAVVQRQPEDEGAPAELPPAAVEAPAPAPAGGAPATDRYEAREQVDLVSGLPTWLTGAKPETEEARARRKAEADKRRTEEIAQIEAWTDGKFEDLSGFEKAGMALALSGRRLWRKIAGIGWPDWRKAGKLLVSLLDPRSALTGVVSGLSMTLSGFANFRELGFSKLVEDPWAYLQNLLKSAADIATGITIVLGSITALAGAIAAIMTAITILSFGFAAPITGPIIAFCTSVMVTVGGWTIVVGKIALILQALVLIKNLVDAYCAESADQLQAQVDQIGTDAGNMLNVGMQVVGAKMAQVGGRVTQRKIVGAGGGVRAAAAFGAGARTLAGRGVRGAAGFARDLVRRGPRRMFADWRAARAARPPAPPRAPWRERYRSWRDEMRKASQPLEKGQAYSADFLLGKGVRSFGEAVDVSASTRLGARVADLAARGTPEALEAATRLAREQGTVEARRLLRRLQGVEPGLPPGPTPGAPATLTRPSTYARGIRTAEEAYEAYNQALARSGGREVGIYQNLDTGEFAVRVGDFGGVRAPWDGEWAALVHYHPNARNVLTYRLPAPQDFAGAEWRFSLTRRPIREVVEFDVPGVGRGRTEFGLEPGDKPYYVKITQPDGRSATLRFADRDAYHKYWRERTTYLEPGTREYREMIRDIEIWQSQRRGEMPEVPPSHAQTMAATSGPPGRPGTPTLATLRVEGSRLPAGDLPAAEMARWLRLVDNHPLIARIRQMRAAQVAGTPPTLAEIEQLVADFARETGMFPRYAGMVPVIREGHIRWETIEGVSLREVPMGGQIERHILIEDALIREELRYFADLGHDIDALLTSRTQAIPPRDMPNLAAVLDEGQREFFHAGRILDYAMMRRISVDDAIREIIEDTDRAYVWFVTSETEPRANF
jgi:Domain of unknown function (DUF4157)